MGFLIKFRDIKSLAEACLKLLKDDHLRKSFGEYSRRIALDKCDRLRSLNRERDFYDSLVKGMDFNV